MKVLVILEFGIPPYRDFLFKFLNEQPEINDMLIVHTGQKFPKFNYSYKTLEVDTFRLKNFYFHKDTIRLIKDYDVIITSFNIYRPVCWLPLVWMKNKKWILWMPGIGRNNFPLINKNFRKLFINRATSLIVYTEQAKLDVNTKWKIPYSKIKVSNNTLMIDNAELTKDERYYFLYVGRIQERKGLIKSLKCCYELKKNYDLDIPLIFVGDGEYKKVLEKYVNEKKLNKLVSFYPGTFVEENLKNNFKNAIAYLSPDHVGLGVVHSFSYGIPIMTCKDKLHAEEYNYCDENNSYLYESDDDLKYCIKNAYINRSKSILKGKKAYSYYVENLDYKIMNNVFLKAIISE